MSDGPRHQISGPNPGSIQEIAASWAGKIPPTLISSTINASRGSPVNPIEAKYQG
jgi:hypothetical protein